MGPRIDKMDERARERAEGGGGRRYDKNTLSIYIPFRPGAEEWWEGGAELREGLECLEHDEKEYMAKCACQPYQDSDSGRIDEEKKWR